MNTSNSAVRDFSRVRVAFNPVFLGLCSVFLAASAHADQCPGPDTCPTSQAAIVQGPNAVELKWIEPDSLPTAYFATSNPPAPNQPVWYQVVDPSDWEDRLIFGLQPNTPYVFTICAYYNSSNQSCVTTNPVRTSLASAGSNTPTPTFTSASVTTNSITVTWNGGRSYDFYHTLLDQGPQSGDFGNGSTGSYQFGLPQFNIQPATAYGVAVQGCLRTDGSSICSQWATMNVTTAQPAPLPALAPQNLHTSNGVSDIQVLWTAPPGAESALTSRAPGWTPSSPTGSLNGGIDDLAPTPGQLYIYEVCLKYQSGTACASTTGALPPKCTISFSCPSASYTPPDYLVQCGIPVDFYQRWPAGTKTFLGTESKFSGTTDDYNTSIVACASGTQTCSGYSTFKGPADWCAPPPPPPPPGHGDCCLACLKAGGTCNRGPHGCTCF